MPPRTSKKKTARKTAKKATPRRSKKTSPSSGLDDPITMILYGQGGAGKTSFAANWPDTGFIIHSQEKGIKYLASRQLVPEPKWIKEISVTSDRSWEPFIDEIFNAAVDDSIKTCIIESLSGIEQICFLHHCRTHFNSNWDGEKDGGGFFDYAKGPKNAAKIEIPRMIEAMDACAENGKHVIFTGHPEVKEVPSPEGVNVLKYQPACDRTVWNKFFTWASCVMFMSVRIEEDKKAGGLRKVAKDRLDRFMYAQQQPYCEAKNWLGIDSPIHCGGSGEEAFNNFVEAIS